MIHGISAIYMREMLILRQRITRQIPSWSISPLLYLIAFGYAAGHAAPVEDYTYMQFLIPGLIAMSSMTQAFAIASDINIARFYWHIFEEFQASPISDFAYVTGEVLAGMTRALLAVLVIMVLGALFRVDIQYNFVFLTAVLLNSFVFSSLAVGLAMIVKSHADQSMLNSFVITPMAFLGGTFFPVDRLPVWAGKILSFLPLTHASSAIRAACLGKTTEPVTWFVLSGVGIVFFVMAVFCVEKAKD
ncbi:MAG: ABC transporter permease [Desulfobacteraceae bacterium]|nr:ABC transporter permease [Desulfobacteraceae bacterium]